MKASSTDAIDALISISCDPVAVAYSTGATHLNLPSSTVVSVAFHTSALALTDAALSLPELHASVLILPGVGRRLRPASSRIFRHYCDRQTTGMLQ